MSPFEFDLQAYLRDEFEKQMAAHTELRTALSEHAQRVEDKITDHEVRLASVEGTVRATKRVVWGAVTTIGVLCADFAKHLITGKP